MRDMMTKLKLMVNETKTRVTQLDRETVVATLNRKMIGWANYFCLGTSE